MKQMAAMDFIREVGPDQYDLNDVSKSLLIPSHRDGIPFWYVSCDFPCVIPEIFAKN